MLNIVFEASSLVGSLLEQNSFPNVPYRTSQSASPGP